MAGLIRFTLALFMSFLRARWLAFPDCFPFTASCVLHRSAIVSAAGSQSVSLTLCTYGGGEDAQKCTDS